MVDDILAQVTKVLRELAQVFSSPGARLEGPTTGGDARPSSLPGDLGEALGLRYDPRSKLVAWQPQLDELLASDVPEVRLRAALVARRPAVLRALAHAPDARSDQRERALAGLEPQLRATVAADLLDGDGPEAWRVALGAAVTVPTAEPSEACVRWWWRVGADDRRRHAEAVVRVLSRVGAEGDVEVLAQALGIGVAPTVRSQGMAALRARATAADLGALRGAREGAAEVERNQLSEVIHAVCVREGIGRGSLSMVDLGDAGGVSLAVPGGAHRGRLSPAHEDHDAPAD